MPRNAEASASFSDTLVFSKTDPNQPDIFSVSLNLTLNGIVNAGAGPTPGANAGAGIEIDVAFLRNETLDFRYNPTDGLVFSPSNTIASGFTVLPGVSFDTLLTTTSQSALVGEIGISFSILSSAFALMTGSSATADFLHTLAFPIGMDVFNLPVGYTVNAGDYLVNNRFVAEAPGAVPIPPALALFATGLGLMGLLGWRRKKQAA